MKKTKRKQTILQTPKGTVATIYKYGMCHFRGAFFRNENKFYGIKFDKIANSNKFWGVTENPIKKFQHVGS